MNSYRRLAEVPTTLRQQGRDVWQFLAQAWIAHHIGGVMPSLLPDPSDGCHGSLCLWSLGDGLSKACARNCQEEWRKLGAQFRDLLLLGQDQLSGTGRPRPPVRF